MDIKIITQKILEDALLFLSKIDDALYTQAIPALFHSTLGKHTRHFIELYQCLLFRNPPTIVNYDARIRDITLETKLEAAKEAIHQIIQELPNTSLQQTLYLHSLSSPNMPIPSNILRELLYNYDHSVHHLAMMRVGLQLIRPDIELPKHIGVAISTLKHQGIELENEVTT